MNTQTVVKLLTQQSKYDELSKDIGIYFESKRDIIDFEAELMCMDDSGLAKDRRLTRIQDVNGLPYPMDFEKNGFAYESIRPGSKLHSAVFMAELQKLLDIIQKESDTLQADYAFFHQVAISENVIRNETRHMLEKWSGKSIHCKRDGLHPHRRTNSGYALYAASAPHREVHIDYPRRKGDQGETYTVWIPIVEGTLNRKKDPLVYMNIESLDANDVGPDKAERGVKVRYNPQQQWIWKSDMVIGDFSIHNAYKTPHASAQRIDGKKAERRRSIEFRCQVVSKFSK